MKNKLIVSKKFMVLVGMCLVIGMSYLSFKMVIPTYGQAENNIFIPMVGKNYPPQPSLYGIHMNAITQSKGLDQAAAADASWTRRDLKWYLVEPTLGERDWDALANLEQEFINAAEAGMDLIAIIGGTPEWALKPGYTCGAIASDKFDEFGQFVYDVIQRYSIPPYNIKHYELYNEPDTMGLLGCWGDVNDTSYYGGEYYGEMLKVVYPYLKSANPKVDLLVGGLLLDCDPNNPPEDPPGSGHYKWCTPARFLEGILRAGGGGSFDGVSFHAYDYYTLVNGEYFNPNWHSTWNTTGPVLFAKAAYIRNLLSVYGVPAKYLINTEVALLCDPCNNYETIFETTKADYLAVAYAAAKSIDLKGNLWFTITGWRNSGLIKSDLSPLLAYSAFIFAKDLLINANYTGVLQSQDVNPIDAVMGYKFQDDATQIWILWAKDSTTHAVTLPSHPDAVYNSVGELQSVDGNVLYLSKRPLYVVWNP